jgi:hypothetical protein
MKKCYVILREDLEAVEDQITVLQAVLDLGLAQKIVDDLNYLAQVDPDDQGYNYYLKELELIRGD